MSLQLKSISQLPRLQTDNTKTKLSEKYRSLLANGADAYIEVSFRRSSTGELSSVKLDFRQFLNDIVSEIAGSLSSITSDVARLLEGYVTLNTNQSITGIKTFTAPTTFGPITCNSNAYIQNNLDVKEKITTKDITATRKADLTAEHAKWS